MSTSPSPAFGLRQLSEMWRVVLAVWLVSTVVFVPARAVVWAAVRETFAALPDGALPDGELLLITVELLRPVWAPLTVAVASGWIALWAWTVLWHAGVVRWRLVSGRPEVRLAEVLGHGLMGWWRWARLGLTALSVLVMTNAGLWMAFKAARARARDSQNDEWLGFVVAWALTISIAVAVLSWLATLRGSWLLGAGNRRSAVLAWLAGLWGSIRQPLRSLITLVVWGVPAVVATAAPFFLGWKSESLRGTIPSAVIDVAAGLLAAFCLVGLFLSFAPVTGLVRVGSSENS